MIIHKTEDTTLSMRKVVGQKLENSILNVRKFLSNPLQPTDHHSSEYSASDYRMDSQCSRTHTVGWSYLEHSWSLQ